MAKKQQRQKACSGSKEKNRSKNKTQGTRRTDATKRRLKMYTNKPKRDRQGKILKHEYQSKDKPSSTRIAPNPKWFGPSRVIVQEDLQILGEKVRNLKSDNYNVILKERKLPWSLLKDFCKETTNS